VTMSLDESLATSLEATKDFKYGGGAKAGFKFSTKGITKLWLVGEKSIEAGVEVIVGGWRTNVARYNWDNRVITNVTSASLTFSTPVGLSGKDGDMVLLLGSVMTLESTASIFLNETSCNVKESLGVVWGEGKESMMFLSRSDSEREIQKLQFSKSINYLKMVAEDTTPDEREAAINLINRADDEISQWLFLINHWDQDREQAKKNKYNLREKYPGLVTDDTGSINTMYLGASTVTLEKTSIDSDSNLIDYNHTIMNRGFVQNSNGFLIAGAAVKAPGVTLESKYGFTVEQDFESTWLQAKTSKRTEGNTNSTKISVSFVEYDAGDTTCIEIYESPWSGTFVFEVCGGATMCPHVEGTDARQRFKLYTKETPNTLSQSEKGKIVIEIDTLDATDPDIEKIDLVVELASATASSAVAFNIGSASLNQPLEFSVPSRQNSS
jgi:hypothetical protein